MFTTIPAIDTLHQKILAGLTPFRNTHTLPSMQSCLNLSGHTLEVSARKGTTT